MFTMDRAKSVPGMSVLILGFTGVAQAVSTAFRSMHAQLLNDPDFSFDYVENVPKEIKPRNPSAFWDAIGSFFNFLGPLLKYAFYLGVIAIAALILYFIIMEAVRLQKIRRPKTAKEEPPAPPPAYTPEARTAKLLLSDVDALAAAGKYDEAVHTLLLRSIQDMQKNKPRSVPRDLTSREISGLSILSETARKGFAGIGERVERSLFGGRALSREDFDICRAAYSGFAFETAPTTAKRRRR